MPGSFDHERNSKKSQRGRMSRRQRRQELKKLENSRAKNQDIESKSQKPPARTQNVFRQRPSISEILPGYTRDRPSSLSNITGQTRKYTPPRTESNRRMRPVEIDVTPSQPNELKPQIVKPKLLPPAPNGNNNSRVKRRDRPSPVAKNTVILPFQKAKPESVTKKANPKVNRQPLPEKRIDKPKKPPQPISPFLYVIRLLIFGVGLGAIAGSILSVWDPTTHKLVGQKTQQHNKESVEKQNNNSLQAATTQELAPPPTPFNLNHEITDLKPMFETAVKKYSYLRPEAFLVELDSGVYFDWQASIPISAASTIKVPVLLAFFQDVDAGKIRLDEELVIEKSVVGGGAGELQYRKLGTKLSALDVAAKMIIISDNTATNMIIARLGGIEVVNKRFAQWGLKDTVIRNYLPDLEGTNTTTPKELAQTMALINQGHLVSQRSRDQMLAIMRKTKTRTLLPQGIGTGATISHKTGDIGSSVGDVGLITMPNGKRYIAAMLVKRPHNNFQAKELIRQFSRAAYKYLNQAPAPTNSTTSPTATTTNSTTNSTTPFINTNEQVGR